MIIAYRLQDSLKISVITANNSSFLKAAMWIDLINPSREEEKLLEQQLAFNIPTREEMQEIELSSRLYKEKDILFMTAPMIAQSDSPEPEQDPVSFVLSKEKLVTIRYIEPQAFRLFINRLKKFELSAYNNPAILLIELLEDTVDRFADILEIIGHRLEGYSMMIFRPQHTGKDHHKPNYQHLIQQIGANADLNTKARECLVGFSRLIPFFGQLAPCQLDLKRQARLNTLSKDISSLSDHASFISSKVNFLLDATLGMINIEQNAIIKIFSVAAVIFLPPTLIASIYGMNFQFMPELTYRWGYLVALGLMLISAYLPYKYFKQKKWL